MKIISICKVDFFEKAKKGDEVVFEITPNGYLCNDYFLNDVQYSLLFDFKEFLD